MNRFVAIMAIVAFCFTLGFAADATPAPKTFGKAITLKEATPISKINAEPTKYADQNVLVAGKVISVCQGMGCWVELETDSARIICKSMDESIHFPKDCAGSIVQVQGKVLYDVKASGKAEMKSEEGMKPHACPAPKVKISIDGATLQMAANTGAKSEAKTEIKEEKKDEKK
jgi:hypothetical protein